MPFESNDWLRKAGHNQGPSVEAGRTARIHAWKRVLEERADAELAPEIIRRRVKRARELGLSYKTYASIRLSAGRDIGGFLFSSNALGVFASRGAASEAVQQRLNSLREVRRIGLAVPPLTPEALLAAVPMLDAVFAAPAPYAGNADTRMALARAQGNAPASSLVAITALPREDEWLMAGRLGGVLRGETYFD
ncbi:hypothetical protein [Pseudooceanicola spongiae]|uniref:Uncharacterized protein n=1 Tax=Pseudooceanicola spongiae TaxID=2613965 RepID=A0A7L9WK62_9RHOB|nr:hypothetical protein [Pseudooceanicola spongiae]QOL80781.1 hypothetical protein F3W81_08105 [Pseudooceanicola spongiae]